MITTWRKVRAFLPPHGRASMCAIAGSALLVGLLEAVLLILVVATGLAVADGRDLIEATVPVLGLLSIEVVPALWFAAACGMGTALLHALAASLNTSLTAGVLRQLCRATSESFAEATWNRQASEPEGALQETATSLATRSANAVETIGLCASSSLGLFAMLLSAVLVDWKSTVVMTVFGAMVLVILQPLRRVTKQRSRLFVHFHTAYAESIAQWGAMAMEHRLYGVQRERLLAVSAEADAMSAALSKSRFLARLSTDLFRDLTLLALVAAAAGIHLGSSTNLVGIGSVVLLVVRSVGYAQGLNGALHRLHQQTPGVDLLIQRLSSLQSATEQFGSTDIDGRMDDLRFEDVSYSYDGQRDALTHLSLRISAGEAVGLVGPSGGGKSTVVEVLTRLRRPSKGVVRFGEVDYLEISPSSWSRLVAAVPQRPQLFEGTVADNIRFHRSEISDEDVLAACEAANILAELRSLPRGVDTVLGPRGTGLSGGQAQRVVIARALAAKPRVLVLDEPTSALDAESEESIVQTIESLKGRLTLLIVAHRLTTLRCCDRIVAIADGGIRAEGSLEEVLASQVGDELSGDC